MVALWCGALGDLCDTGVFGDLGDAGAGSVVGAVLGSPVGAGAAVGVVVGAGSGFSAGVGGPQATAEAVAMTNDAARTWLRQNMAAGYSPFAAGCQFTAGRRERGARQHADQNFELTDRNVSLSVVSRRRELRMRTMLQSTS